MWYNLNNLSMGETPSHIKYISRRQLYPVIDFRYSRDPLHIRQFLSEVDGKFYISYYPPPFKYIYFPKNKAIKILYTSLLKKSNISEDQVFKNVYRLMWEYASKDKYHRYDGAYIYGDITTNSYCYDNYVHFPGYSLKVGDDSESYATPCVEGNSAYKESWYTNKIYNVDQLNSSGGEHYNDYHPFINSPDYYARSGTPQVGVVYSGTDIPYKRTTDVHYPRYYPQSIAPHVWSSTDLLGKYEWDSTSIDLADSFFWGQSLHGYASDKFFGIRKIKLKTSDDSLISYGYEFPSGPTNTFIPFYLTGPLKGRCLLLFYRTIPRGEGFSYLETSQMFPSDILKDSPWLNKEDYQDEYEYWANLMYHSSPLTGGVIFPISFFNNTMNMVSPFLDNYQVNISGLAKDKYQWYKWKKSLKIPKLHYTLKEPYISGIFEDPEGIKDNLILTQEEYLNPLDLEYLNLGLKYHINMGNYNIHA